MAKVNWRKLLGVVKQVGTLFLPDLVSDAIDRVEDNVSEMRKGGRQGWDGAEKQTAALEAVLNGLVIAEGLSDKDLLNDATVRAAGVKAIDAVHASKVALAELKEAVDLFRASKVIAAADGTGTP